MSLFYKSFIESVLMFAMIAWYGNLNIRDKNHLSHIVKVAGKVFSQSPLMVIFDQQVLRKAWSILDCTNTPFTLSL